MTIKYQPFYRYHNERFRCCRDMRSMLKPLAPLQMWPAAARVVHTPMNIAAFMGCATHFESSAVSEIVT